MKKTFVRILSTIFPTLVANFAYNQITNPQIRKLRPNELGILDTAEKTRLKFKGFDIQTYKWQGGPEQILLIHGWEGQAGNFADLIKRLVEQDYTVFAFDGPSHGFSSKGPASLFEFGELVGTLIRKLGVSKLVSHSFGGVATTYALFRNLDLQIDKYVLLTTPDRFLERIEDVSAQLGIKEKARDKLIKRLEHETSLDVKNFGVSEFVKVIKVRKSLIIHDKNDTVVPINRSRNVFTHWKGCEFMEVEGTGHFRMLRSKTVLDKTLAFLEA